MIQQPKTNQITKKEIQDVLAIGEFPNNIKIVEEKALHKYIPLSKWHPNDNILTYFHFRNIATQFFYLLFTCSFKRYVPLPYDDLIFYHDQHSSVYLCLKKFIPFEESGFHESQFPYFQCFSNFVASIQKDWKKAEVECGLKKAKLSVEYFMKQIDNIFNMKFKEEKQYFRELEKSELMMSWSTLLKINNSTVLAQIQSSKNLIQQFKIHRGKEFKIYSSCKHPKNNRNQQLQLEMYKKIQNNLLDYFRQFKTNPKFVNKSHITENDPKIEDPFSTLKINLKLNQKVFEGEPPRSIDYDIEYCISKGTILVRLFTDLVLDWVTSDSIMFKWNTLSYQSSNIGLEIVKKNMNSNKPKQLVAIRAVCNFNRHEPHLQKVLILMDICTAKFRAIQTELKQENTSQRMWHRISEEYFKKVNHYFRVVNRAANSFYMGLSRSVAGGYQN